MTRNKKTVRQLVTGAIKKTVSGWQGRPRNIVLRMLTIGMLTLLGPGRASAMDDMSEQEYLLLPEYCRAQGVVSGTWGSKYFRKDLTEEWGGRFGDTFRHIHHYCWGLVWIARSYKTPLTIEGRGYHRVSLAREAIADIRYTIDRASPGFELLPEMYTKSGEAYLLARDDKNAEAAFRKAWEIRPSYWRPYVWWAQRLMQLGRTSEALDVAEEGQKNAPGVKALEDLIRDLRAARKTIKK